MRGRKDFNNVNICIVFFLRVLFNLYAHRVAVMKLHHLKKTNEIKKKKENTKQNTPLKKSIA